MRSTRSMEILCLALAALVLVWSHAFAAQRVPVVALLGLFALAIAAFSSRRFLPGRTRVRLLIESWSMLAFIAGVLWLTGKAASPMLNLFLLPIILSALALGRLVTLAQVGVICAFELLLAAVTPGIDWASLGFASRVVGELAPVLVVAYLTATLSADVTEARERIENLAQTDPLTGLANLRRFNELCEREHAASQARGLPYAMLMIDVEQLKELNDAYGHDAGNSALSLVAECLKRSVRASDVAARFGGDEFAVLLPNASPEVADAVVKRIRNHVFKTTLDVGARMIRCDVSVGVANFPKDGLSPRELLSQAEQDLYRDKDLRRVPGSQVNA